MARGMTGQFEWREVTTEFRDVRPTARGDELRWLVVGLFLALGRRPGGVRLVP